MPPELDLHRPFGAHEPNASERAAWLACGAHQAQRLPGKALWKTLGARYPGPFDVTIDGMNLRLYPIENFGDREIVAHGRIPERDEFDLIDAHVSAGDTFVDVGASIGLYAIWASRKVTPEGRVFSFEPLPRTRAKLEFNLAANDCANVVVFDHALGEKEAILPFYPDAGKNAGRSSVLADAVDAPGDPLSVTVKPLPAVLTDQGGIRPDLLKVDVEGFEDRVVMPLLRDECRAFRPKGILLETAHSDLWEHDLMGGLAGAGYSDIGGTAHNRLFLSGC